MNEMLHHKMQRTDIWGGKYDKVGVAYTFARVIRLIVLSGVYIEKTSKEQTALILPLVHLSVSGRVLRGDSGVSHGRRARCLDGCG